MQVHLQGEYISNSSLHMGLISAPSQWADNSGLETSDVIGRLNNSTSDTEGFFEKTSDTGYSKCLEAQPQGKRDVSRAAGRSPDHHEIPLKLALLSLAPAPDRNIRIERAEYQTYVCMFLIPKMDLTTAAG